MIHAILASTLRNLNWHLKQRESILAPEREKYHNVMYGGAPPPTYILTLEGMCLICVSKTKIDLEKYIFKTFTFSHRPSTHPYTVQI